MTRLLDQIHRLVRGKILAHEPLDRHTSLRVGGPADLFVTPADLDDLLSLLELLSENSIPWLVIGGGYNLLVKDGGFRGVVISLANLQGLEEVDNARVRSEAGVTTLQIVRFLAERELAGLEFLSGIPGTIGGALAVNAGAHGQAILEKVQHLVSWRDGTVVETPQGDLRFGYRNLVVQKGEIILGAEFQLEKSSGDEIRKRISVYQKHRQESQQVKFPNAGSFFKNPQGRQAWQLIAAAGLRGAQVGGAQVAEEHANFLVNCGGATASDFLALAELIKKKVKESSGIELLEEVRIVGEG